MHAAGLGGYIEQRADADFITIRALDTTPENAAGLADAVNLAYRQMLRGPDSICSRVTFLRLDTPVP